jgi:hypothetical protein
VLVSVRSNDNLYTWYSYLVYWQIRTCFTYLLRLLVESVHVSLVAADAEKLTMTSRRPSHSHKKSRQEMQSTAAFFEPSTAPSGATAASGEATGIWGLNPHLPPGQLLEFVQNHKEILLGGDRRTPLSCFSLLEIVTVKLDQKK